MRPSSLLNLGLIAVGAAAAVPTLRQRHRWEQSNRRAYIVLDYDDALAVIARAGMPLRDFLCEARQHGATHLSLPELTLERLMREGRVAPVVPEQRLTDPPPVGRWTYLASAEPELLGHLAHEFAARLPASRAQVVASRAGEEGRVLALSGHLPTLAEMGLGFEAKVAADALLAGLEIVPRPASFSWPEARLIERTMIQVAGLGPAARIVAFDGDLILGHEMYLDTTVNCLERLGLHFAYFCETRHQKGDWFIAKRLAPKGRVILAHYFTPAAMVPEDFHSAAHHWGMLARARGIRLCYINVFRRIHAADPLECLHYLEHVREELEASGLAFEGQPPKTLPSPDRKTLALAGLASAGAASLAVSRTFGIAEPLCLALTAASAAGAAALPWLDRPRGHLEESYPPSYAPKLLALAGASAAPLAPHLSLAYPPARPGAGWAGGQATGTSKEDAGLAGGDLFTGAIVQVGVAASLGALTTGQDYQQRIEAYRSLNADLFLPLAGLLFREVEDAKWKAATLIALGLGWYAANRFSPDLLGQLDRDLPAGHTHHLSAAQRLIGDALLALGPRPGRRWAGLGLAGLAAARALRRAGRNDLALAASLVGAVGNALMLAAFRQPERPLAQTLPIVGRSWAWGAAVGLAVSLLSSRSANIQSSNADH
jgi:hypothetical protein